MNGKGWRYLLIILFLAAGIRTFWPAQANAPTAIELLFFRGTGLDNAVWLEWETATEFNTSGFWIERANSEAGPYTRLVDEIGFIWAEGSGITGRYYDVVNEGLVNGQTYWYRLVEVESNNNENYEEPIAVTAGIPTPTPTAFPTATPTPILMATNPPAATATPSRTPTMAATPLATATPTLRPSQTPTGAAPASTATPSPRATTAVQQPSPTPTSLPASPGGQQTGGGSSPPAAASPTATRDSAAAPETTSLPDDPYPRQEQSGEAGELPGDDAVETTTPADQAAAAWPAGSERPSGSGEGERSDLPAAIGQNYRPPPTPTIIPQAAAGPAVGVGALAGLFLFLVPVLIAVVVFLVWRAAGRRQPLEGSV